MRDFSITFQEYLQSHTEYAVQLNGVWGKGKTFYYKTILEQIIRETRSQAQDGSNYAPIYISLFGIKSIEEIQIKIYYELIYQRHIQPKDKDGEVKRKIALSGRLLKLVLRGAMEFAGIKGATDLIKGTEKTAATNVDTTSLVICFDDLERINKELTIEDLTGYINSLVEEQTKVLIISNEDKLGEKFKEYKEKIVGITQEFEPKPEDIIQSIISSRYKKLPAYQEFLLQHSSLLISLISKHDYNYRHLIFGLERLQKIFTSIHDYYSNEATEISDRLKVELSAIAKITLICAIEFKAGQLKASDLPNMKSKPLSILFEKTSTIPKPIPNSDHYSRLIATYYEEQYTYKFYESIFQHTLYIQKFDIGSFIKEFIIIQRLDRSKELPEYTLLKDLNQDDAMRLNEKEYKTKTEQLIQYALDGKYKLAEYLTIQFYAQRWGNPLSLDLDALAQKIIRIMEDIPDNQWGETAYFEYSNEYSDQQQKIRQHGYQLIKNAQAAERDNKQQNILKILTDRLGELQNLYAETNEDFKYRLNNTPFLALIDIDKFSQAIINADLPTIFFLTKLFEHWHQTRNWKDEIKGLNLVNLELVKFLNSAEQGRTYYFLTLLQKTLDKIENSHGPNLTVG